MSEWWKGMPGIRREVNPVALVYAANREFDSLPGILNPNLYSKFGQKACL